MLISSLDPERSQKIKTMKVFEPTESSVEPQIVQRFVAQQHELVELMRRCEMIDTKRIIVTSPAAAFVTYSLLDAFRIIAIHEVHHFVQTSRLIQWEGFPAAARETIATR